MMIDILLKIFRRLLRANAFVSKILALRCSYALDVRRIRAVNGKRKLKVMFLVGEIAKWKLQSLYDLMTRSRKFELVIGITVADIDLERSTEEIRAKMRAMAEYFRGRGMASVEVFDPSLRIGLDLHLFHPDIVFYQQPWRNVQEHAADQLCNEILTCYVPYFVQNYGDRYIDYGAYFHKTLWRYFIINRDWEVEYGKMASFVSYAGRLKGLGHPALDYFALNDCSKDNGTIVYAPHWSFDHPNNPNMENYGTILWTGDYILNFAREHREFKWVFKPHPTLRHKLGYSMAWNPEKIDLYWKAWSEIGEVCEGGDYQEMFARSKAMITDCGSFLTEYFCTGKPLIHLISPTLKIQPSPPAKKYFETFYQVHDEQELLLTLERVLMDGDDYKGVERRRALKETGFADNYAARNILGYLESELRVK